MRYVMDNVWDRGRSGRQKGLMTSGIAAGRTCIHRTCLGLTPEVILHKKHIQLATACTELTESIVFDTSRQWAHVVRHHIIAGWVSAVHYQLMPVYLEGQFAQTAVLTVIGH